ncbi:MAG: hypothetical protein JXB00_17645 [Bacteroidales bacterium]|nr:hypothetical protein [Bacteroidales bacterium]
MINFPDIRHIIRDARERINPLYKYPQYKDDFYKSITFSNYLRLRIWTYFLIVLVVFQLYSDLNIKGIYSEKQTELFFQVDIILAVFTLFFFVVSHFFHPDSVKNVRKIHGYIFLCYIFFHLNWGGVVSAIESQTANGLPTYLIGVFSLAALFFVRGWSFLLMLSVSLLTLFLSLRYLHIEQERIVAEYYSVFTLVIIGFLVSKVILTTRLYSFIATKKLEETNDNLDKMVKERTVELSEKNQQLLKEISERKRYERELLLAVKRAEEADRLKTVFLANLSHEIRTPLNGILGFSDLLNKTDVTSDRKKKYVEIIMNSGQQLLRIIDDILDISLIESNQLRVHAIEFNLNDKIREIYDFFYTSAKTSGKDKIRLIPVIGLSDEKGVVFTDPFRLQQVINNLLKNAYKFTFEGEIEFGYECKEKDLLFFVSDTGIGIEPEKREIIFERFRQGDESLKRNFGGAGLGLSISKGIVEQLGGKIWLDISTRKGSRFFFTISKEALLHPEYHTEKTDLPNGN